MFWKWLWRFRSDGPVDYNDRCALFEILREQFNRHRNKWGKLIILLLYITYSTIRKSTLHCKSRSTFYKCARCVWKVPGPNFCGQCVWIAPSLHAVQSVTRIRTQILFARFVTRVSSHVTRTACTSRVARARDADRRTAMKCRRVRPETLFESDPCIMASRRPTTLGRTYRTVTSVY